MYMYTATLSLTVIKRIFLSLHIKSVEVFGVAFFYFLSECNLNDAGLVNYKYMYLTHFVQITAIGLEFC